MSIKLGANTYFLTVDGHIFVSLKAGFTSALFFEESPGSNAVINKCGRIEVKKNVPKGKMRQV